MWDLLLKIENLRNYVTVRNTFKKKLCILDLSYPELSEQGTNLKNLEFFWLIALHINSLKVLSPSKLLLSKVSITIFVKYFKYGQSF